MFAPHPAGHLCALLLAVWAGHSAWAEANSLFGGGGTFGAAQGVLAPAGGALIVGRRQQGAPVGGLGGSLFVGQSDGGLFAPYPVRQRQVAAFSVLGADATVPERIRHLIGLAEAGPQGYDAVQHGARVRPQQPPTAMTIAEIYAWIEQTPGQPHAIGRYQFIPATLRRLVREVGLSHQERFTPAVQDLLADELLAEAGLADAARGQIDRHQFMHNLAKIWAGLPTATGQSYYHGYAGNRATMTWARFDAEMGQIFPG